MAVIALVLIGLAGWGLTRVPTGFIPTEDQGYLMIAVQMPDGASLERAQNVMDRISKIGLETPGAAHAIAIGTGGPSPLDGDVSLANAGIVYLMLKSWGERGRGEDLEAVTAHLQTELAKVQEAHTRLLVPAPIQGLGASTGFQMQVELTDGSYDFERLQRVTDEIVREANASKEVVERVHGVPRLRSRRSPSGSTRRRRRRATSTSATSTTRSRSTSARASSTSSRGSATTTWSISRRIRCGA